MAAVASESSHPGRPNADFRSPGSDLCLVVISLGAWGPWSQQVWEGRAYVCEAFQLYMEQQCLQMCAVSWKGLSALGQGSDLLLRAALGFSISLKLAGFSISGFSISLELAGKLTLLLIQPSCKLGKQMFWFIICHLHSYLCPCAPYTQCQIKSVLFAWQGRRSVCVVWPESRVIHPALGSTSPGWSAALLHILKHDGQDCSCSQPAVFIRNHYFVLNQSRCLWNLLFPSTVF